MKWIPTPMVDVARRAVADAKRITAAVRADAAWMAGHPGRSRVAEFETGSDYDLLDMRTVATALGIVAGRQWCEDHGVPLQKDPTGRIALAKRRDLRGAVIADVAAVPKESPLPLEATSFSSGPT